MGWVQEIVDLFAKLSFYSIVHEWEQGLYVRRGRVVEKRIKLGGEELERVVEQEGEVLAKEGRRGKFPQNYRTSLGGYPIHPKRGEKDKILRPGVYFNWPIIDDIIIRPTQETPLDLKNIQVPTADDENNAVNLSCNIRYEVLDLYRAFTAVFDYENSLSIQALSCLAEHSRGKKYSEWKQPEVVKKVEDAVKQDLGKIATKRWGLKINEVTITSHVSTKFQGVFLETTSNNIKTPMQIPVPIER